MATRRSVLVLLLTLIYIALYAVPIGMRQFLAIDFTAEGAGAHFALGLYAGFIQIYCLIFALTFSRWLWRIVWPLICLCSGLADYMVRHFNSNISADTVAVLFESTLRETSNFLTFGLASSLLLSLALGLFGVVCLRCERKEEKNRVVAVLALIFSLGVITIHDGGMATSYPPYHFLTASWQYAKESLLTRLIERKDISAGASYKNPSPKRPVVVLVIGESARADHFSLNGYKRFTNPLLAKRRGLLNFAQVTSCGVFTRVSVPCMLTASTLDNLAPMTSQTSVISVFKQAGFYTAWLGAQNAFGYPTTAIMREADQLTLLEGAQFGDNAVLDEHLLPPLERLLKEQPGPLFIIVHSYGSHWQYSARYSKLFEKFTPVCGKHASREFRVAQQIEEIENCHRDPQALANSYDNSILYTDYFLDQVIRRLEHENALFTYISDHGESLGEEGRFLHGYMEAKENRQVPMLWWASQDFMAYHAAPWHSLQEKRSKATTQDVIFPSLIDCSGVSLPSLDKSLSLCATKGDTP